MAYTTINKSTDHFNTKLYTGNGSTNAQTGVGFQPDWLWVKCRSDANGHQLFDALRTTYSLSTNETDAEANRASDGFTSLDSDGFTMNGSGNGGSTNFNSRTYVAWNWKANGAGSANTDGTINSTVSVNTTAGFSIVSYTGNATNAATVGHGLGVAPKVIIIKNRSSSQHWRFHTTAIDGSYDLLYLNLSNAKSDSSITAPTSSVFTLDAFTEDNGSGNSIIAYCFAEKTGYSKFGSYTGNGNADGTFIYTGFKPAFFLMKETTDSSTNWIIYDNKRSTFNAVDDFLKPNSNDAESTGLDFDFLSNGIKCRNNNSGINASGQNYIYMAFGQSLVGSNNVPCTAR